VSEPTKAYRCYWKSGVVKSTQEVAANTAEDAITACMRDVAATYNLPADSIEITKVEAI
jgi:ribosomal protein L20A (L18A)